MLKLGCTLPYLAKNCLHKSTDSKIFPFTETAKDLLEKRREVMFGRPFSLLTCKALVDEILVRESTILCKSIVGIDASLLFPHSMCQLMVCIQGGSMRVRPSASNYPKNKSRFSRIWSCHVFNNFDRTVELRVMLPLVDKRNLVI